MPRMRTYRRKTKSTASRKSKITKRRVKKTKRRRTHIKMRYRRGGGQREYDSLSTDAEREEREKAREAEKTETEETEAREKRKAEDPHFDIKEEEAETYTEEQIIEKIENILNNKVGYLIMEQKANAAANAATIKDLKDQITSINTQLETIKKRINYLNKSTVVFTISSRESQRKAFMAEQARLETVRASLVEQYNTFNTENKNLLNTIDTYRKPLEKLLEICVRRFPKTEHRSRYAELIVYFTYTVPDNEWIKALYGKND